MIAIIATVVPKICDDVLPVPKIMTFHELNNNLADVINCKVKFIDEAY